MGTANHRQLVCDVIDNSVRLLARVSHFWDSVATVSAMSLTVLPHEAGTGSWIVDHAAVGSPPASDMAALWSSLDSVMAAELHGARLALDCTAEEILLAALGRTVARTIGEGIVAVDVAGEAGGPGTRRVAVACVSQRDLSGRELLAAARPTVDEGDGGPADVGFVYGDAAGPDHLGHRLALRVHRDSEATLLLHWRFDARSFDHCTVQELAEQFPLALIEITSG